MSDGRRRDLLALLFVCGVVAVAFGDVLISHTVLGDRDLPNYHFPQKKVVRDLVRSGESLHWNRLVANGQPLAANPANNVFYPPQWIVFFSDFVRTFHWHIVLHLILAGAGMFVLLRIGGLSRLAAVCGALSYAFAGPALSTLGLLPFLFAWSWWPWVAASAWRFFHQGARATDFAWAAVMLAMVVLLSEPVTLLQTFAIVAVVAALSVRRKVVPVRRGIAIAAALLVAGLLLGAVQLIPAVDFARDTIRSVPMRFSTVAKWSLPVIRPLELFFPDMAGSAAASFALYHGSGVYGYDVPFIGSLYLGLMVAILVTAGLICRTPGWRIVAVGGVLAYVAALGEHTPLLRILFELRLLNFVRYPEKFILIALFGLVVYASMNLQRLIDGDDRLRRFAIFVALLTAAVAVAFFAAGFLLSYPDVFQRLWKVNRAPEVVEVIAERARTAWFFAALRALIAAGLLASLARVSRKTWSALVIVAVIVDAGSRALSVPFRLHPDYYTRPPILDQMPETAEPLRIFHEAALIERLSQRFPTLWPIQSHWMHRNDVQPRLPNAWGVETVMSTDVDETYLLRTRFFETAMAVAWQQRHASWPDLFMSLSGANVRLTLVDDPSAATRRAGRDLQRLSFVRIVPGPPDAARYYFARSIRQIKGSRDFLSVTASSPVEPFTAFIPAPAFLPAPGRIHRVAERPDSAELDVEAAGTSLLVASVTEHRYWRATIDGRAVKILGANLAYQAVVVPRGRHRIRFEYRNPMIAVGGGVTGIAVAGLVALVVLRRRQPL